MDDKLVCARLEQTVSNLDDQTFDFGSLITKRRAAFVVSLPTGCRLYRILSEML
jgi:hypothetical protein